MGRLAGFVVKRVRDQRQNGEVWHPAAPHNGNLYFPPVSSNLSLTNPTLGGDNRYTLKDPEQS